jgi:peptide/nickel transport system ATP-binding protein
LELFAAVKRKFDLALLFITHDLRVAAQVCDRVAVMHRGQIVEEGPIGDVFLAPKHHYTRELLAAAPGKTWVFGPWQANGSVGAIDGAQVPDLD